MLTGECWWVVVSCRWCYIINHWLNKLTSDILLVNFTETPVKFSRENQGTWTMRETSCWNYSSFCAVLYVPDALKLLADTHAICWQLVGATTDVSNSPPVHSRDGPKFGNDKEFRWMFGSATCELFGWTYGKHLASLIAVLHLFRFVLAAYINLKSLYCSHCSVLTISY